MDKLLAAIVEDDRATVTELLARDRGLVTQLNKKPRLYPSLHWLYVGDTALHLAAAGHRVHIVRQLLAAGADPNAAANHRRGTPLHYASDGRPGAARWDAERQVKTIRLLLDAGAKINAQDKNGAAALHRAVRTRCAAAVQCLLQDGADPMLKNNPDRRHSILRCRIPGEGEAAPVQRLRGSERLLESFLRLGSAQRLKRRAGRRFWNRLELTGFENC
jgi:hypothetical protein